MTDVMGTAKEIIANVENVIVGKRRQIILAIVSWLCEGHILLEDVPGVAKTMLARTLAKSVGCRFKRIQCTPDLLPTDVTGASIFNQRTSEFEFRPGPIFAQIVLADEINRTTPRTQSALLEAMNESQVTMDGQTYRLGPPFMVIATQNPFQFEGTYFLPENQLDRFMMRIRIGYPDRAAETRILAEQPSRNRLGTLQPVMSTDELLAVQKRVLAVSVDEAIMEYVVSIAEATRQEEQLALGLSPRGALALVQAGRAAALMDGRDYVVPDDVKRLVRAVVAHRLLTRAVAQDGSHSGEAILEKIIQTLPAPQ